jgi:hypothetical protein
MAETVNSFNEYIEEGSKLSNFADMFSALEDMGKDIKSLKGMVDSVTNLSPLSSIKDKFSEASSLNEKINEGLKKLGLTDKTIALLNKTTGGLLSKADPFIMSAYGAVETFARTILEDAISSIMAKVYIPEDVFLLAVKGLAGAKSDPNYRNVLRMAILQHDLVKTIEWLDNFNGIKYSMQSSQTQDAVTASKYGSFHVAAYIIRKLRKTYIEIKASPTLTESDENRKALELAQYEHFYNTIIRNIFVYSYDNLTVDEFSSIVRDFPTFTPSCLGSSDEIYSRRAMVTTSDIEILAPLRKYTTVEVTWNSDAEEKVFIVPRNHNIKKLYVWLAYSIEFNDSERLVNEPLHRRLSYKILSTVEEAFYEAQKSLLNSPLGKYVFDSKDSYLGLIAKYVQETEQYLFDPRKQDIITGEDRITLPDFRPVTSKKEDNTIAKSYLPIPTAMADSNLTFDDFVVYYIDPSYDEERIVKDGIGISRTRNKPYVVSKKLIFNPPDQETGSTENLYLIYFNDKFNSSISESNREIILDYVVTKYVIDYYTELDYPLESIATMFPELNSKGIFYQFIDYANKLKDIDVAGNNVNSGADRELDTINFYNQILSQKGETIKIDPTGVNVYNIFGEKVGSITDVPENSVGLSLIDNDLYALALNPKTGNLDVYYSDYSIINWIKMDVNGNDAIILPGIGVTSIYQINLFESFYYNNLLFILKENKIFWSQDKINFTELSIMFSSVDEIIQGISFLPDGNLYILTDKYFYMIEDFTINGAPYTLVVLSTSIEKFNVYKGMVGTVINAVSIPLDTMDDFDINDKKIINRLVKYYSSSKFMYYWYSVESEISIDLFNENISRLQEKLNTIVDPIRRKQLERCIERQIYFKEKMAS